MAETELCYSINVLKGVLESMVVVITLRSDLIDRFMPIFSTFVGNSFYNYLISNEIWNMKLLLLLMVIMLTESTVWYIDYSVTTNHFTSSTTPSSSSSFIFFIIYDIPGCSISSFVYCCTSPFSANHPYSISYLLCRDLSLFVCRIVVYNSLCGGFLTLWTDICTFSHKFKIVWRWLFKWNDEGSGCKENIASFVVTIIQNALATNPAK